MDEVDVAVDTDDLVAGVAAAVVVVAALAVVFVVVAVDGAGVLAVVPVNA